MTAGFRMNANNFGDPHRMFASCSVLKSSALFFVLLGLTLCPAGTHAQTATPPASAIGFGTQAVGVASTQAAVTFNIGTGGVLGAPVLLTQGTANLDFTLGTGSTCTGTVSSNSTCTVYVVFTPKASLLRLGAVELTNSSGTVIATARVYGVGQSAVAHFLPGVINTVAGSGGGSYNGDGAATSTELSVLQYIVADGAGNMYFADEGNNRVRYYNAAANTVTTVVGSGSTSFNYGGSGVTGTSANITPVGLAIDGAGNLYIADTANARICKYDPVTKLVTVLIGSGTSTYSTQSSVPALSANIAPFGVAVDVSGNVYFTEAGNNVVRVWNASTGNVTPIAGNGTGGYNGDGTPATSYEVSEPTGIAVGQDGNVYITEFAGERLRKVTVPGATISTVIGNGNSSTSSVIKLAGIKFNAEGDMYLANQGYNVESKYTVSTQTLSTIAGNGYPTGFAGDGGSPLSATLWQSNDLALDNAGNIFISDEFNHRIRKVTYDTPTALTFSSTAVGSTSTQTETIQNDGNANLVFTSIKASQAGVSNYFSTGGTCSVSTPVAPGASCTVVVTFAPLVTGAQTGTVTLTDNSLTATQTFSVNGTASAASGMTAQTINFTQPTSPAGSGTSATLIATASSGLPVTFSVVSGPASMISSNVVAFTGVGTVVLQAANYGNSTYAAATAQKTVTTVLAANVGATSPTQTVTMTIAAAGTVGSIRTYTQGVLNEDYTVVSGGTCAVGATYSANQTCTVNFTFTPQHPWTRAGGIVIGDTSGNIMSVTYANGTGNGPQTVIGNGSVTPVYAGGGSQGLLTNDNGIYATSGSQLSMDAVGNIYSAPLYSGQITVSPVTGGPAQTICSGIYGSFTSLTNYTDGSLWAGFLTSSGPNNYSYIEKFPVTAGGIVPTTCNSSAGVTFSYPIYASALVFGPLALYSNTFGYVHGGSSNSRRTQIWTNNAVLNTSPSDFGDGFGGEGVAMDPQGNLFFVERKVNIWKIPASELAAANASSSYAAVGSTLYGIGTTTITTLATDGWGDLFFTNGGSVYKIDYKNPPSLSFAATAVGATSTPQTLYISNNGNTTLTISSIVASTNFLVTGGTCGANSTVAPSSASSCTITVALNPQTSGALSGTLTVYDNSLQGSHVVNLSGTGGPVVTSVSPNSGPQAGGTAVTISGSGFTGASAVNFGATAAASFTVNSATSISATSPPGSIGSVDVTVTAGGLTTPTRPADTFSYLPPTSYTAPTEPVGTTSAAQTAYVIFATAGTLGTINVLTQGAANKDFKFVSGGTCTTGTTYSTNQTCSVLYTFTPSRPGQRLGAVSLTDNTGAVVLATTLLNGTGTGPVAIFPGSTVITTLGSGFYAPTGVAVDGGGNVFVGDYFNNQVKEIVAVNGSVNANSTVNIVGSGFNHPQGVAVDGSGNVYVADSVNNAVKEIVAVNGAVSANSTVITLGSGFNSPRGVVVDGSGDVFVADSVNNAVKVIVAVNGVIPASPTINTIGSGFNAPFGVALDGSGNIFVADSGSNTVKEIIAVNGAVNASSTVNIVHGGFNNPASVAVDAAGNIFLSDEGNLAVREIAAVNGVVSASSTVYTIGSGFGGDYGVALDGSGHLFIADSGNSAIKEVDLTVAPSLAFTGTAVGTTSSDSPQSVTLQNAGNAQLSFSSISNATANFVQGGTCRTSSPLASSGVCTVAASFTPQQAGAFTDAITMVDNSMNVAGSTQTVGLSGLGGTVVTGVLPNTGSSSGGTIVAVSGSGFAGASAVYFGTLAAASFTVNSNTSITATAPASTPGNVVDVTVVSGGNTSPISTADQFTYTLPYVYTAPNEPIGTKSATQTAYMTFTAAGMLGTINVLTQGAANKDYKFVSGGTCAIGTVYAANQTCTVLYTFTPSRPGQRMGAVSLTDSTGTVVLGTSLLVGTGTGPLLNFVGNAYTPFNIPAYGFSFATSVAVDGNGDVFVADYYNNSVDEIVAVNGVISTSSQINAVGSGFSAPLGIAVDGSGNVFVTDSGSLKEIVAVNGKVDTNSTVLTLNSSFGLPYGLAIDGSGDVFVADYYATAITEIVAVNGVVSASSPVNSLGSNLNTPVGVAVDASGNVFVASSSNGTISEIVAVNGVVNANSNVNTIGSGFGNPFGVAVDAAGNVFVDSGGIAEIVATNGVVTSSSPVEYMEGNLYAYGLTVDGSGHIFAAAGGGVMEGDLTVPAAPLAFEATPVGTTSADSPQNLLLQNAGNAPLTFTTLATGTSNFTLGGGCTMSTQLAASTPCSLTVSFTPQQGGALTDTLTLVDNTLNVAGSTQTIALSGTAPPAITSVSPNAGLPQGGQTVTISGTGFTGATAVKFGTTAATSFQVVNDSTVTAVDPAGAGVVDITVTVAGTVNPTSTADQFTYWQSVGTTSSSNVVTLTITAAGKLGAINVLTQGASGKDFQQASSSGDFQACGVGTNYTVGHTCTVHYTFTPSRPGQRMGAISLTDSTGTVVMANAYITGIGSGPLVTFPTTASSAYVAIRSLNGGNDGGGTGVALDGNGNLFFVSSPGIHVASVANYASTSNTYLVSFPRTGDYYSGIAVDGSGNVYYADQAGINKIVAVNGAVSASSTIINITSSINTSGGLPQIGLAVDGSGNLFAVEAQNGISGPALPNSVIKIAAVNGVVDQNSPIVTVASGFAGAWGLTVDPNGNIFVAETGNNAVKEIVAVNGVATSSSPVVTVATGLSYPTNVAVDGSGNVFVSEFNSYVKEIVAVNGTVSSNSSVVTVSPEASQGLAVDGTGHIYTGGVYQIDLTTARPPYTYTPLALSFANTAVGATSSDSPKSISLQNAGNAPLAFTSLATGTANFAVSGTGTCSTGTPLVADGFCAVAASFTPQTTGALTDNLTLTDNSMNALGSTQAISLAGTGENAKSITFPQPATPVQLGAQATLNATASNGDAVTYSITAGTASLNGNDVTFTTSGSVTITASSGATSSYAAATPVSVTVFVQAPANLAWSPGASSLYLGTVLGAGVLDATSTTAGTITYTATLLPSGTPAAVTSSTTLAAGSYTITATVTPTDTTTYTPTSINSPFTVVRQEVFLATSAGSVASYFHSGAQQSAAASGGGIGAAVDSSGNVWSIDADGLGLAVFNDAGVLSTDYRGTSLNGASALAVDGAIAVWVASADHTVKTINASGTVTNTVTDSNINSPSSVAIDQSGNVWVANQSTNTLTVVIGGAAPSQPLATAVQTSTPGVKP